MVTATSINGLTISTSTGTLTITNGKTVSFPKTMTLTASGDSAVITLPNATVTFAAPGTSGNVLTSDGTDWTSAAPATASTINLIPNPSAGGSNGIKIALTSTETQAIGDVCNIDVNGKAHLAKADAIANANTLVMATAAVSGSAANTYLVHGVLRLSSSPSWTVGGFVYLSTTGTTTNTLTQTAPSGANNVIQILGVALAADTILFAPQLVQVEHT